MGNYTFVPQFRKSYSNQQKASSKCQAIPKNAQQKSYFAKSAPYGTCDTYKLANQLF